jgi:Rrf2 family nitric oxide-sensitive transcriptional repressor
MFSQTVEYALRAMMCLASFGGEVVSGEKIAARAHVPGGYLSKVMRGLVVAELVRSFRGPNGGFALARDPGGISILDVVNAVDPIHRIARCPINDPEHSELCALHRRLDSALEYVEQTFRRTTLAEVLGTPAGPAARNNLQGDTRDRPGPQ